MEIKTDVKRATRFVILLGCVSLFFAWAIIGMIFWGIGMGAQESILKAAVAGLIPPYKRGTAFGLFNTGFGVFGF